MLSIPGLLGVVLLLAVSPARLAAWQEQIFTGEIMARLDSVPLEGTIVRVSGSDLSATLPCGTVSR